MKNRYTEPYKAYRIQKSMYRRRFSGDEKASRFEDLDEAYVKYEDDKGFEDLNPETGEPYFHDLIYRGELYYLAKRYIDTKIAQFDGKLPPNFYALMHLEFEKAILMVMLDSYRRKNRVYKPADINIKSFENLLGFTDLQERYSSEKYEDIEI